MSCILDQTVLQSKVIRNEKIMETLMIQANSGTYRVQESYLDACKRFQQQQESTSTEWTSTETDFDLWHADLLHDTPTTNDDSDAKFQHLLINDHEGFP